MAILDDVKITLRISSSDLDTEVSDLISAAQADLSLCGIYVTDTSDALIKRCINTYCKANFGYDVPEADRFMKSYDLLKQNLMLTRDYATYTITFDVNSSDGSAITEAKILIEEEDGYNYTIYTNQSGLAKYYTRESQNVEYTVSKSGYTAQEDTVDLTSTQTITVNMTEV